MEAYTAEYWTQRIIVKELERSKKAAYDNQKRLKSPKKQSRKPNLSDRMI